MYVNTLYQNIVTQRDYIINITNYKFNNNKCRDIEIRVCIMKFVWNNFFFNANEKYVKLEKLN